MFPERLGVKTERYILIIDSTIIQTRMFFYMIPKHGNDGKYYRTYG